MIATLPPPDPPAGMPKTAMVLTAGLGTRMRPLTETMPKPLVAVHGKPMLDHVLDRLVAAGVTRVVMNLHHLGQMIRDHMARRQDLEVVFTEEATLLETGGGVHNALAQLGDGPFYVINGDVFWLDGPVKSLHRLAEVYDPDQFDGVLLLTRTVMAYGYSHHAVGDFFVDLTGRPRRRGEREVAPYVFAGVQLLHPRAFAGQTLEKYSLNRIYTALMEQGRLRAVIHDGEWFHIGTPEARDEADQRIALNIFHSDMF